MTTLEAQPTRLEPSSEPGKRRRSRAGWRLPLRVARRESWRAKARSALIIALVMLPVLVITAASTLARTSSISAVESVPREMGSADAAVQLSGSAPAPGNTLVQCPDLTCWSEAPGDSATDGITGEAAISKVLGDQTRIVTMPSQQIQTSIGGKWLYAQVTEAPLSDPMLTGMVTLVDGRLPNAPGEVVVTDPMGEHGAAIGTTVDLGEYGAATVVGTVDSLRNAYEVFAMPGGLRVPFTSDNGNWYSRWLVTTPGGVSWDDVLDLNAHGLLALSTAVVHEPPTQAELAADPRTASLVDQSNPQDSTTVAILGLIVVMVLLEIVLLAGPAFAVGASSQTRAMGLLASQGATRKHLRRVVLAQAVVLGGIAAVVGVVAALLACRLAYPWLLDSANGYIGPFEFGPADVLIIAAFGFGSAVLAALMPARAAAKLDPVRAMAGRRTPTRRVHWHTGIGAALVLAGTVVAYVGARSSASLSLAVSALLVMVGAVLLAPLAITVLARLTSRNPIATRYAVRDMARNQLRTAPAVAAVTAVVAAAVALGIAGTSQSAYNRANYVSMGPMGDAFAQASTTDGYLAPAAVWEPLRAALVAATPGSTGTLVEGVPSLYGGAAVQGGSMLTLTDSDLVPQGPDPAVGSLEMTGTSQSWTQPYLIGQAGLDFVQSALTSQQVDDATAALEAEQAVFLTNAAPTSTSGTLQFDETRMSEGDVEPTVVKSYQVPSVAIRLPGVSTPATAILPESFVAETGVTEFIAAVHVDAERDLTKQDEADLQEVAQRTVTTADPGSGAYVLVETGWQNRNWVLLLILGTAAALLAIGGSLTAALLALSDARADFATLGAVGAPPSMRRRIAGAYGASIALLGAVIGAAVGFIPGIAACFPLTAPTWYTTAQGIVDVADNPQPDVFIVIPWGLIGALVVGLPVLVGLIIMVTTRSRLPMVQRIE